MMHKITNNFNFSKKIFLSTEIKSSKRRSENLSSLMVLFGIWSILVAMKRIINERGGNLGDSMHEEIAAVYKGSNDEETFTAAFMFMEYYLDFLFKGCRSRSFQLEDSAEEWILRDLDIENRWAEPLPSIFD